MWNNTRRKVIHVAGSHRIAVVFFFSFYTVFFIIIVGIVINEQDSTCLASVKRTTFYFHLHYSSYHYNHIIIRSSPYHYNYAPSPKSFFVERQKNYVSENELLHQQ